ncbi:MAG: PilZ domain-containing protein [Candidatus Omnitrophica bacterium]|nr:PilZ domain-containing protein [Candidatus Omnitrophota bacterium]
MVKKKIEERRHTERAKHVLSIQYRLNTSKRKSTDKSWHLSTTQDMSAGGLSFLTDQDFITGDILDVKVVMSGVLDIYKGKGEIVRVMKKRTGANSLIGIQYLMDNGQKRAAKRYAPFTTKKASRRSAKRI